MIVTLMEAECIVIKVVVEEVAKDEAAIPSQAAATSTK
jgi:hypothetical protein